MTRWARTTFVLITVTLGYCSLFVQSQNNGTEIFAKSNTSNTINPGTDILSGSKAFVVPDFNRTRLQFNTTKDTRNVSNITEPTITSKPVANVLRTPEPTEAAITAPVRTKASGDNKNGSSNQSDGQTSIFQQGWFLPLLTASIVVLVVACIIIILQRQRLCNTPSTPTNEYHQSPTYKEYQLQPITTSDFIYTSFNVPDSPGSIHSRATASGLRQSECQQFATIHSDGIQDRAKNTVPNYYLTSPKG